MEIIFELVLRRFVVGFLGVNFRYLFFVSVGNKKSFQELKGENSKGEITNLSQNIFNIVVGLSVFAAVAFSVVYLVF